MSPKKMNLVLKVSLGLIGTSLIAFLYLANQHLTSVAQETAILKARLEIGQTQLESYEVTKTKVEELAYVKELAKKILPADEEQSAVVAELSSFAKRSSITISALNFNDASLSKTNVGAKKTQQKAPSGVTIVPVTLTASDEVNYSDLLTFLNYVEKNQRKMQVTQLSITPNTDDGGKLSNVTITLNLFVKASSTKEKQ